MIQAGLDSGPWLSEIPNESECPPVAAVSERLAYWYSYYLVLRWLAISDRRVGGP